MIKSVNQDNVGAIMWLDMLAAFDTVDHMILLDVFSRRFSVQDEALHWLEAVLADCRLAIHSSDNQADDITLKFGVPEGSVIGLFVFFWCSTAHQHRKAISAKNRLSVIGPKRFIECV